ncbi:hypothetical protein FT663_01841 [Candidozyma haemuli var. vulneris]|uniref:Aminotransferase class I/classII large domain-containing protein n=1 Tax=Candidozyma haemuli TaxID=45357 RepID=A0A2V1ANW6_9ASCO|nr:hypothetical protein CXQ85_003276 [[Candida] haemuloni]KAF3993506.1 hypothetical protein FT663_01841 [[Candida] haemuloni var. vulneris]KAF3993870.1 hypothetical protein FT662_00318 [[Candida] haemuloni var. vulneris]PVH19432.1 hypothetical protein CXQ85_003276 [[Candida] haemuloni]
MAHLLSNRASSRQRLHFSLFNADNAPEGFEPHPDPLWLDAGMPNAGFFPIDSLQVNVVDYPFQKSLSLPLGNISLENLNSRDAGVDDSLKRLTTTGETKNHVVIPKKGHDSKTIDLSRGLQYSEVEGLPQLLDFTRKLVKRTHAPKYDEWTTILSNGAGDGLNKAADAFLDPGDIVLVEEFTFTPFLLNVQNAGAIPVPVKLDLDSTPGKSNGINIEYLEDLLENWEKLQPEHKSKKPKALYTIASGQNPTGFTQSVEFRQRVYNLAEKYDFAIIEDDPYGYLTLPPFSHPDGLQKISDFLSIEDYLEHHLVPSYLTFDTSGRVLRIETFSKLFAPGLRLGFIVGHKDVIRAISNYANVVTRSSSGTSQLLVNNVIEQSFGGVDGWLNWVLKIRLAYINRRNVLLGGLYDSEAFKKGYFEVIDPRAGMFASVIINFPEGTNVPEKMNLLQFKFRAIGVKVVTGLNMAIDKKFSEPRGNFFRLTYAVAGSDQELREGAQRFSQAVYEFFQKGLEF